MKTSNLKYIFAFFIILFFTLVCIYIALNHNSYDSDADSEQNIAPITLANPSEHILSGLVHYWPFDEEHGDIIYDVISGKNGKLFGTKRAAGISGFAIILDGIDDYATLPENNPVWLPENDFTVSVWVFFKADPNPANKMILDLNYSRTNELGYNILYTNRATAFQLHTISKVNEDLYSNFIIPPNQWHNITNVRKGDEQAMYIDGKLNATRKCLPDPIRFVDNYDDNKVNIGRYTTVLAQPRYFFKGKIDELKIYDRALSPDEINQVYNSGYQKLMEDFAKDSFR